MVEHGLDFPRREDEQLVSCGHAEALVVGLHVLDVEVDQVEIRVGQQRRLEQRVGMHREIRHGGQVGEGVLIARPALAQARCVEYRGSSLGTFVFHPEHFVSTSLLCVVEADVGQAQHVLKLFDGPGRAVHVAAARRGNVAFPIDFDAFERLAPGFDLALELGFVGVERDRDELVAAIAVDVRVAERLAHAVGERAEQLVALRMAVGVVVELEVVDVAQQQVRVTPDRSRCVLAYGAAVLGSGERIVPGHMADHLARFHRP